ncbi:hypothetical protein [Nonomuraea typhae]|uniref:Type II toxin-antitoxin system CcdA family antitoxin n=1 Tax=Nonomuraea typhae TaxID=2603600 RepID=A0ABW7YW14_9ACTN
MAEMTRVTVTLPSEQVAALKKLTDNVSGYVAEAVAQQIRHHLLGEELRLYQEEFGAFTDEERAEAQARIQAATMSADKRGAAA